MAAIARSKPRGLRKKPDHLPPEGGTHQA